MLIAAFLWFIMFSPWTSGLINFWKTMSASALVLCCMSFYISPDIKNFFHFSFKDIAIGIGSAIVLWGIFYLGDLFSSLLFDFSRPQVNRIYQMKDGQNLVLLSILLITIIGPAEELFWRGFIQRSLIGKWGEWGALAITTLAYSLVHIWSFNFMLIMAALVCGLFWGLLYRFNKNLTTIIISHALWDFSVFILFPI